MNSPVPARIRWTTLAVTVFYTEVAQLLPSLKSFWQMIHVIIAIVAVALFTVGFSVTVIQQIKAHREASPPVRPTIMEGLPGPAALDRTVDDLHRLAFPLWTFTLMADAIWSEQAWGVTGSGTPQRSCGRRARRTICGRVRLQADQLHGWSTCTSGA